MKETQVLVSPYVQMSIAEMKINSDVQESYSGMSHEIFHVRPNAGWGEMDIKDNIFINIDFVLLSQTLKLLPCAFGKSE